MNPHVIVLFIIGGLEFAFGVWLVKRYVRSESIISFSIFVFSVALWVWSNLFFFIPFDNHEFKVFVARSSWYIGVITTVSFLYFSRLFPYRTDFPKPSHLVASILPVILFIPFIFTNYFITDRFDKYGLVITGKWYFLFIIFFLVYWGIALTHLIRKYRNSGGIHKWQLKYFLIGVLIPLVAITISDVILPGLHVKYISYLGAETSIIWLAFCGWIVIK